MLRGGLGSAGGRLSDSGAGFPEDGPSSVPSLPTVLRAGVEPNRKSLALSEDESPSQSSSIECRRTRRCDTKTGDIDSTLLEPCWSPLFPTVLFFI